VQKLGVDMVTAGASGATIGRGAALVSLLINDVALFQSYGTAYSTTDGLINAQGFYYSLVKGAATAVAWGLVHYSGFSGTVSVVPFTTINVNMQNVFSTTTNKVTIPVVGIYLIDLTVQLYGSGIAGDGNNGRLATQN
jgi:hypothetical protein